MFRKHRILVISPTSLHVRELRFFRIKLFGSGVLFGIVLLAATFLVNFSVMDFLGLGYSNMSVLAVENRILRDQINQLTGKMGLMEETLGKLSERGNELRLLADMHRIDDDTRKAAAGGSQPITTEAFLSGEIGGILTNAQSTIGRLTREVKLQMENYDDIRKKMEFNKGLFASMPAIRPMVGAYSASSFGMRTHPVLRIRKMHPGIDITNDVGTPVYATGDGEVLITGPRGGYGKAIEISHGYGYSTLYAHLSEILVHAGQSVKRGELIARSGRSGLVSGPHLHYEVHRNGTACDPIDFFFDDIDAASYRLALARSRESTEAPQN